MAIRALRCRVNRVCLAERDRTICQPWFSAGEWFQRLGLLTDPVGTGILGAVERRVCGAHQRTSRLALRSHIRYAYAYRDLLCLAARPEIVGCDCFTKPVGKMQGMHQRGLGQ